MRAKLTGILGTEIAANRAKADLGLGIEQGLGQFFNRALGLFEDMKSQSLR
jgi:hypothetical protein